MRCSFDVHFAFVSTLVITCGGSIPIVQAVSPDDPGTGDVLFSINTTANERAISPYIYGMNSFANSSLTNPATSDRLGGNRWTGYNWETNASNAGSDWYHHSDNYLVGGQTNTPPGQAVLPTLQASAANGRATIVTVPMAGYVAADTNGTVDETEIAPSSRFREVVAEKATIYPGSSLSTTPNENDGYVFTDEFVHWVENNRQNNQPVFYSLDNEPGLWGESLPHGWDSGEQFVRDPSPGGRTHPTIHPYEATFAELRNKTIAHASAIKNVAPNAIVLGGVGYGWQDFRELQGAPDKVTNPAHPGGDDIDGGELHYYEWLLQEVAAEEQLQGRTLMDVLDLHWYPEAQGGGVRITENNNSPAVVAARVQAGRSLWDPTYAEVSWISQWMTSAPGETYGPVELLPRVQRDIEDFKPGTKISISEYNYGGTNHISGAIAQADVLGVFASQEVFAANMWNLHGDAQSQFASGAFKMYLDYDGTGGAFGDTIVNAATDSLDDSAVYASIDEDNPPQVTIIAINRTADDLDTAIAVTSDYRFDSAEVYQLTSDSSSPVSAGTISIDLVNAFRYSMPAYSVSTLVLNAISEDADFDQDGFVSGGDFLKWQTGFGIASGAELSQGDANADGAVDSADLEIWRQQYGSLTALEGTQIPEPSTALLLVSVAILGLNVRRRKKR